MWRYKTTDAEEYSKQLDEMTLSDKESFMLNLHIMDVEGDRFRMLKPWITSTGERHLGNIAQQFTELTDMTETPKIKTKISEFYARVTRVYNLPLSYARRYELAKKHLLAALWYAQRAMTHVSADVAHVAHLKSEFYCEVAFAYYLMGQPRHSLEALDQWSWEHSTATEAMEVFSETQNK